VGLNSLKSLNLTNGYPNNNKVKSKPLELFELAGIFYIFIQSDVTDLNSEQKYMTKMSYFHTSKIFHLSWVLACSGSFFQGFSKMFYPFIILKFVVGSNYMLRLSCYFLTTRKQLNFSAELCIFLKPRAQLDRL
jgi:hypothetical protein